LVVSAMASLPPNDREALQLVLWEELTHAQAATVLNCSVNAFEIRYRRARNTVKEFVEKTPASYLTPTPTNKRHSTRGAPQ
jgi:DNA-directed RNA polymerase specialized sigma24 family protein